MAKKKTVPGIEVLDLNYNLAELPSSQHRAGLAGLVLMVQWLKRQDTHKGICEIIRLDERGTTLRINQEGLVALFDVGRPNRCFAVGRFFGLKMPKPSFRCRVAPYFQ